MELNCAVVNDLLVMYSEGLCSEETKALVEAHLEGCEECRETYRRLTAAEPFVSEQKQEEPKSLNAKKVLKRIRRRWIALLVCVLLLVPITFLSVNEARGTGLSFSAVPYVIQTRTFLAAINDGAYEKAFSMTAVEEEYESYITPPYADFSEHPLAAYQKVEIGGTSYYVSEQTYQSGYQTYLMDGDEVRFWYGVILDSMSRFNVELMIPEQIMEEIVENIDEDLLFEEYFWDFVLTQRADGMYYMYRDFAEMKLYGVTEHFPILPEGEYDLIAEEAKQGIAAANAYCERYAKIGLEEYVERSAEEFVENLESIARQRIEITDWRMTDVSKMEEDYWFLTYALSVTKGGEPVRGVTLTLFVGKDGIRYGYLQDNSGEVRGVNLVDYYALEWED